MKRKIVFLIVTLGLVAGTYTVYKYLYKDHRNIATETSALELTADELKMYFTQNISEEVLNKTLSVTGTITQIEGNTLTLDEIVHCTFTSSINPLKVGDEVIVKGRCIGYDDLFEIVKLDQSIHIPSQ